MNEKDYLIITKKRRLENSQGGNRKNKLSINIYLNKSITELNELIYVGGKLVCEKFGVS